MPAQTGIQELEALTGDFASWIPGLAALARNDVTPLHLSESTRLTIGSAWRPNADAAEPRHEKFSILHLFEPRLARGGKLALYDRWIFVGDTLSPYVQREMGIESQHFCCCCPSFFFPTQFTIDAS